MNSLEKEFTTANFPISVSPENAGSVAAFGIKAESMNFPSEQKITSGTVATKHSVS